MGLSGQSIGQYEIIEPLGAGGMATVYKAYQPGLDRYVAVKVLPAQHALTPGFRERFSLEAKVIARLNHPHILPVYDAGIEGDLSYFVMKYVQGPPLRNLLGQPMDLDTVSRFTDQVAAALDHAHDQGIVHRDVKPTNVLLENDWVWLADFGLAKLAAGSQDLTGPGAVLGTPAYLSPEQAEGDEQVDHRADIYSLGVMLYEMIIGQVPYEAGTAASLIFKHAYAPVPRPRLLRPGLSAGIEWVILTALAKDPEQRFDRAGELAEALRANLAGRSVVVPEVRPDRPDRVFLCYKRSADPDERLADYLYNVLTAEGQQVFIDRTLRTGDDWLSEIDRQLKASDFVVVLLSKTSADSEMVQAEVKRAADYRKQQGRPRTLPVRVAYEGLLPYAIDAFLDPLQYVVWQTEADNERLAQEVLAAIAGHLPQRPPVPPAPEVSDPEPGLSPPQPEVDPRGLDTLDPPGGVVKLRDKFYVERQADVQLNREVRRAGTTTTIRAPRQTGKSSLLVRGAHHARQHGAQAVNLDLQRLDAERLASPDLFLRDLAEYIVRRLRLDPARVEQFWQGSLGPQDKLTYLMEDYVLAESDSPIILALDEVDRLLNTPFYSDFFALLRSWHNSRALDEQWDRLNLVMVISTEPHQLIADVNQSPFNVGLKIYLEDFDRDQVRDLNRRHGSPVSEPDFDQLVALLGGHPYLTRKAMYTMVIEGRSWEEMIQAARLDHGPFGDHLRRLHWMLHDEPQLKAALKQVIEEEQCSDEMALFRLLKAGLVKGSGETCACRCDLYRIYFKDKV